MTRRSAPVSLILILILLLLLGAGALSGQSQTPKYPPHQPDLRLAELARSSKDKPDLFTTYDPKGRSRWNQGWPWKLDLSGVAWDIATTATAITPRHVVMAKHFQREIGASVVFHDRNGKAHERRLVRILPLDGCDVAVGLLDRPLPDSVRSYPLPKIANEEATKLVGAIALVTDQDRRLFFHRIYAISPEIVHFRSDPTLPDARHKRLIVGDSGNPSFFLSNGELVLIETHTTGGGGGGPFYGASAIFQRVRDAVAELDPTFEVRTVKLDPAVFEDAAEGRQAIAVPLARPTPARPVPQDVDKAARNPNPGPRVIVPPKR